MGESASRARLSRWDVLVGTTILLVLLGLANALLTGPRGDWTTARCAVHMEVQHLMTAREAYNNDFGDYPPGYGDTANGLADYAEAGRLGGNLGGNDALDLGSGHKPAKHSKGDCFQLQLRTVTTKIAVNGGQGAVGPYYEPRSSRIDAKGRLCDRFGSPYRYLRDGRPPADANGSRAPGRVKGRRPVIWSVGADLKQDAANNNLDDDGDGKVDDQSELDDDICSWFGS